MNAVDVTITITDTRDGSTYVRNYLHSADWSDATRDMIDLVMPGCWADFADRRGRYGNGMADGIIRDSDYRTNAIVGKFHVEDVAR